MGLFHVAVHVTGPSGRTSTLDALVDTGATLLVLPRPIADQLELVTQVLGAVALESLFLAVDPVAKRLVQVEGFVG
jgi:predicted aspartyl protease